MILIIKSLLYISSYLITLFCLGQFHDHLFLIHLVLVFRTARAGVTYADETSLRAKLKTGYDQAVRPSTPTTVVMFYSLRTLQSLVIFICLSE